MNWPWDTLGLSGPAGLSEIRKAYARLLREIRPEEDPERFQRLSDAYREACRQVREGDIPEDEDPEDLPQESAIRFSEPEVSLPLGRNWDFEALFQQQDQDLRQRCRSRAQALLQRSRPYVFPWTRRRDEAIVDLLTEFYYLERSGPSFSLLVDWKLCFESASFRALRGQTDFLRAGTLFFNEHPQLPRRIRSLFLSEYQSD